MQHRREQNVFADEPPQHFFEIRNQGVETDDSGLQHLTAAEREELLGQAGGTLARLMNFVDVAATRVVRSEVGHQQIGIAADGREDVVEVVCHATRQAPDRLHFLRQDDLFLEQPAIGHVAIVVDNCGDARIVEQIGQHPFQMTPGPVLVLDARGNVEAGAGARSHLLETQQDGGPVIGVDELHRVATYEFRQVVAQKPGRRGTAVYDGAVRGE